MSATSEKLMLAMNDLVQSTIKAGTIASSTLRGLHRQDVDDKDALERLNRSLTLLRQVRKEVEP